MLFFYFLTTQYPFSILNEYCVPKKTVLKAKFFKISDIQSLFIILQLTHKKVKDAAYIFFIFCIVYGTVHVQ